MAYRFSVKSTLLSAVSAAVLSIAAPASAHAQNTPAQVKNVEIEAQTLSSALLEFTNNYGIAVSGEGALLQSSTTAAVSGEYTAEQALANMLKGTGLQIRRGRSGGYVVEQRSASVALVENTISLEDETETIVVTGSRIERLAIDAPSPIDVVTKAQLNAIGLPEVTEVLRFVPALNQSTGTLSGITTFAAGPLSGGLATLDLRGLGTERTLVLVNGKRHVAGVPGEASVDISSIPTSLIERVEVLTGGGSSIYGADAVSGVVNFIIKDDFEGLAYEGSFTQPTQGGGQNFFASVTAGGNFGGGRGNAVITAEYQFQDEVTVADRFGSPATGQDAIANNSPELAALLGFDPAFQNVVIPDARSPFGSTLGPVIALGNVFGALPQAQAGNLSVGGIPTIQLFETQTGVLRPFDVGVGTGFTSLGGDGFGALFGAPNGFITPQIERYSINGFADYDIHDKINAFIEVKYTDNEAALVNSGDLFLSNIPLNGNPFLPQALQDQLATADALDGPDSTPTLVANFSTNGQPLLQAPVINDRETFRIVGGFRGDVSSSFNYEVSANYGRTDTAVIDQGEVIPTRLVESLDVVEGPDGTPVCASELPGATPSTLFTTLGGQGGFGSFTPGAGQCVPFNIFAPVTQDVADFVLIPTRSDFTIEQFVINAAVKGSSEAFFKLPAGPVGYAFGIEYREEDFFLQPDAIQIANLGQVSAFNDDVVLDGGFDVFEGFAEVNVPVLRDLSFAKALDFDASFRVADYSTVGTTTSFAFGVVYQPVEDFRIRGSFNRSVRAPNLGELFSPQVTGPESFGATEDPCASSQLGSGTEFREGNCAALIPVPLDEFSPINDPIQDFIVEITGGNPNLNEETAETFTIGFVYTPSSIPGLSIVVDYYNIEIDDAIEGAVGLSGVLNNCVDASSTDNAFCSAIIRDPVTGQVEQVSDVALNIGSLSSQGIDYQINYAFDLDRVFSRTLGRFNATISGTYLIEREDIPLADFPETLELFRGEIGFPKHFLNFGLGWSKGQWSADYGFNFQSNQVISSGFGDAFGIDEINANPLLIDGNDSGIAFVHNIGGTYEISERVRFSVRVNNLANRDPFPQFNANIVRPTTFLGRTVQFAIQGSF